MEDIEQMRKRIARESLDTKWYIPQKDNFHSIFEPCAFCEHRHKPPNCLCPPKLCECCRINNDVTNNSLIAQFERKYGDHTTLVKDISPAEFRAVRRILLKVLKT
jgi:hypothetical protein